MIRPDWGGEVAEHVDAVSGGVELLGAPDHDAGMNNRGQDEVAPCGPDDEIDRGWDDQMHNERQRIVKFIHPDDDRLLLQPERHWAGHVFCVPPDDPANPCPTL